MRYRETEKQRYGVTDDTQDTDEVPSLAACVKTLQEAAQRSLQGGLRSDCLFVFSRALKAFEVTTGCKLPSAELGNAFSVWWSLAKSLLPSDADFDEYRFDFELTFAKTLAPLGSNSLEIAIHKADSEPPPPQAARYSSPKIKRLVAVCYQLQLLQARSPFFLSVRDAARITDTPSQLLKVSGYLTGLCSDGVLTPVEQGTRKRAARYRFNLPEHNPATNTNGPSNAPDAGSSDVSRPTRTKSSKAG